LDMRLFLAALVLSFSAGCASHGGGPSVKAFSDSDGVLHVDGSGWRGCGRVAVRLPEPWTGSETAVGGSGRFSLMYAHPEVTPYKGAVVATCADSPKQRATTEIRVGDARSQ
jgi:hypothetical protein